MNIVLLQTRLKDADFRALIEEFPQYLFLTPSETQLRELGNDEWDKIEIFYGVHLTSENLEKAHALRWVHCPSPSLNALCLNELQEAGRIILTFNREENHLQIGEYVIGGVLAFAKNLFHWEAADKNPTILWDSKWRDSMWSLKNRIFLQVGLGSAGTEIARLAKTFGMQVWGVQEHPSFHPYCNKVFSFSELHSLLPGADVVCIALPRGKQKEITFKKTEFGLMKDDSILAIIGSKGVINEGDLAEVSLETGKFRGILLDAFYQVPVSPSSKLWKIPNIIITPEVAPRPKFEERETFRTFRFNLRQYLHGNFSDMKNIVGTKQKVIT